MRQILDFNKGWRFANGYLGDSERDFLYGTERFPFAKVGEEAPPLHVGFDDSQWQEVTLPHDWTVRLKPVYTPDGSVAHNHGFKPFGVQFPQYCIGWYRKKFYVDEAFIGKKVFFEFDGAFRNMQLFVNGIYVARNESGYIGNRYDITDMLFEGEENIIAARLDTSMAEGWFYEGCGFYRPVRLILTDSLHILDNETVVTSELNDNDFASAVVNIKTVVQNDSSTEMPCKIRVMLNDGETVAASADAEETVGAYAAKTVLLQCTVQSPKLWSPEAPNLYKTNLSVLCKNEIADDICVNTGIRKIVFDPENGLFINGEMTKVKGVCCHQDHAGVGSAISESLYEYRIALLKEMGANAYRCAHNPPAPQLLDVCDRLGMLVMDENRLLSSGDECLNQCERLIKRDRNHPCVFIWSMANEEGILQHTEVAKKMGLTIKRLISSLDATRPVTYAPNNGACETGVTSVCDVRGWNYMTLGGIEAMDEAHRLYPHRPILGSEEASTVSTRGVWFSNKEIGHVSDYGEEYPGWGASPEQWWSEFAVRPYLAGSFVWTGFDYRGEPTPYTWPNISSHFGIMDLCGFPKGIYYYYKANWTGEDVIHICPDWNIQVAEGTPVKVKVYTNCEQITLYLNGKQVGTDSVLPYHSVSLSVPYEKGVLKAVGLRNGKTVSTQVETADKAAEYAVSQRSVTAKGEKTTVFTVTAQDKQGRFQGQCDDLLSLSVENGTIIGVGNGNPSDHESDLHKDRCRLFKGLLSVIVSSEPEQTPSLKADVL